MSVEFKRISDDIGGYTSKFLYKLSRASDILDDHDEIASNVKYVAISSSDLHNETMAFQANSKGDVLEWVGLTVAHSANAFEDCIEALKKKVV